MINFMNRIYIISLRKECYACGQRRWSEKFAQNISKHSWLTVPSVRGITGGNDISSCKFRTQRMHVVSRVFSDRSAVAKRVAQRQHQTGMTTDQDGKSIDDIITQVTIKQYYLLIEQRQRVIVNSICNRFSLSLSLRHLLHRK